MSISTEIVMNGSFVLILHTHLPYVLRHGKWPHGSDWLCEAAAECYIPLLNECHKLLAEGITPNITVSISPVVAEQLDDPEFITVFNNYLDEKIEAAESDIEYFQEHPGDEKLIPVAEFWKEWFTERKQEFAQLYGSNLCNAFAELQRRRAIALQTCGATHGYFPLLGRDESIQAQIRLAYTSHTQRFGAPPRGIWMPECAYRPAYNWRPPIDTVDAVPGPRKGVEELIAAEGVEYTIVDAHLVRGGKPLGSSRSHGNYHTTATEEATIPHDGARSIYALHRIGEADRVEDAAVAVFARDEETTLRVWSGAYGYPSGPEYLEFHKKHHNSGLRYWRITDSSIDLGMKQSYQPEVARQHARRDAKDFARLIQRTLNDYHTSSGKAGTLAAPFDTELFGHWWLEGPVFLAELLRELANGGDVVTRTAPDELDARNPAEVIALPEGSWGDGGDHRVWVNDATAWTWKKLYEVEATFLRLLEAHNPDDKTDARLLRQMAREQLLLQASDWQFLITTASAADYATERFTEHYTSAMLLADYITTWRTSGTLETEGLNELGRLELLNPVFRELSLENWRIATPKIKQSERALA